MKSGMEVRTITDYGVFVPAKDTQKDLLKHYQEIIQKIKNEDDSILHINQEIKQQN